MKKYLLFGTLVLFISISSYAQVSELDSLALVNLYNSTDGSNWSDNTNWLTGPLSTWNGITVTEGRVTSIDLFGNNLSGSLPSSFGNLTNLAHLTLINNSLTGELPASFSNLINLIDISLKQNELSGEPLPILKNITGLIYLDLESNNFTGTIPADIDDLSQLNNFRISDNQFEGTIPAAIGNLTNLERFRAYLNNLTGSIPAEIGNLVNLIEILLQKNNLTGHIPAEIGNLTNLTSLQLWGNQLDGPIPPTIGNIPLLVALFINENQLSGELPEELGNLKFLNYLSLSRNNFTGTIPESYGKLTNLAQLRLDRNQLEGKIPDTLKNLNNVVQIWLSENDFYYLPDLSSISSLNQLDVDGNLLTFDDIERNLTIPNFYYTPQKNIGVAKDTMVSIGSSLTLEAVVGGSVNAYQWMKDGEDISGANDNIYTISSISESDSGIYNCRITSSIVTDLTLYSAPVSVNKSILSGVEEIEPTAPNQFVLFQNFPNPFNPTTKIKYTISDVGTSFMKFAKIKVYDVLGNEIATLVNEERPAGSYEIEFDASSLTSGVYFYTLSVGSFNQTNKMLLLK